MTENSTKQVIIIGSGPAAWTAALYAARAELRPLVFTGFKMGGIRGGQLMTTTDVENYPGFPNGVSGTELVQFMEQQARRIGVDVLEEDVLELDLKNRPFTVWGSKTTLTANSLIIATGAYARKMDIKGGEEFWNKGISACAVCDGPSPMFRGQDLAVIGGGDSACEEALFLTKFAKKVYLIVRKDQFRASKIMEDRVRSEVKIEIMFGHILTEVFGEQTVKGIVVQHVQSKEEKRLSVGGLFYAIGHEPNTSIVKNQLDLDDTGYIKVRPNVSHTSVEGVFAAGDVFDHRYRQAITAAGSGCMAAIDAERWLQEKGL